MADKTIPTFKILRGSVGIGTNTPISPLDVTLVNSRRFLVNYDDSLITIKGGNNGGNPENLRLVADKLYFNTGTTGSGSEKMRIQADGNVGIGTTAPSTPLEVYKNGSGTTFRLTQASTSQYAEMHFNTDTNAYIFKNSSGYTSYGGASSLNIYGDASTPIAFHPGAKTNAVFFATSGNVGIGATTPAKKLTVYDTTPVKMVLQNNSSGVGASDGFEFYLSGNNAGIHNYENGVINFATNNTNRMIISAAGAIQFNTYGSGTHTGTSAYKLSVDSSGNIIETSIGSGAVDGAGTTNYLPKWTDSDTIGNSTVYNSGSFVGISTASTIASSAELLGVYSASTGHTNLQNASDTYGTIYVRNLSTTASTYQPYIILSDGGGNRGGLGLEYSTSKLKVHGQGGVSFWTGASFGGGTEKVIIASDGKVGIGTTAPGAKLHVGSATTTSDVAIRIETDNASTYTPALQFAWGGDVVAEVDFQYDTRATTGFKIGTTAATHPMSFVISDVPKMYIDGAGLVGIGTTTPADRLHVKASGSSGKIISDTTGTGGWTGYQLWINGVEKWGASAYENHFYIYDKDADAKRLVVMDTGKVGIGTDAPSTLLQIESTDPVFTLERSGHGTANGAINFQGNDNVVDWQIGTNRAVGTGFEINRGSDTANKFYITTDGDVGIGTAAPGAVRLYVLTPNSGNLAAEFRNSHATGSYGVVIKAGSSSSNYSLDCRDKDSNVLMRVRGDGKIGIGTTAPSGVLHIRGDAGGGPYSTLFIESTTNHGGIVIDAENTKQAHVRFMSNGALKWQMRSPFHDGTNPDSLRFYSWIYGADVMTLTNDGNVGIGTTTPDELLHLNKSTGTTIVKTEVAGNSTVGFEIKKTNATTQHWRIVDGQTVNGRLEFYDVTDSRVVMAFDGNGNVGINDVSPTYKLDVNGTFRVTGASTLAALTGTTATFSSTIAATELNVSQSANSTRSYKLLQGYGYTVGGNYYGQYAIGTTYNSGANTGTLEFFTGSGSSAPTAKLTIASGGTATFSGNVIPDNNGGRDLGSSGAYWGSCYFENTVINGNLTFVGPGLVKAGDGTAAAPSHTFRLDADTGMYSDADNILRFSTGGSHRVSVLADGKVGIGTTDPGYLLDVNGTANIGGALTGAAATFTGSARFDGNVIVDTDTGSNPLWVTRLGAINQAMSIKVDDRAAIFELTQDETTGTCLFLFNIVSSTSGNKYYQFNNGRVGINRIPSTNYDLDVVGAANFDGALTIGAYTLPNTDGTAGYHLETDGAGSVTWEAGGGTVTGSGTDNYIPKWNGTTALENSIICTRDYGVVVNSTNLNSYATNRQVFEVSGTGGTAAFDGGITNLSASSSTNAHKVGRLAFINAGNANHVSPTATAGSRIAEILTTVVTTDSNAGGDSGGDLQFWTKPEAGAPAERMRIQSDGNVGIGTTAPGAYKLNVNGSGYFGSTLNVVGATTLGTIAANSGATNVVASFTSTDATAAIQLVDNNGNCELSTTSGGFNVQPAGGAAALTVNSSGTTILISGASANKNIGILQLSSQAATYFIRGGNYYGYTSYHTGGYHRWFGSDGSEDMRLDSTGLNVSVGTLEMGGTTVIDASRNITGTSATFSGSVQIGGGQNLTWGGTYGAGIPTITALSGGSARLQFYPAGSTSGEKMRITADGKVGIGTTAPSAKLHVVDSACDILAESTTAGLATRFRLKTTTREWRIGSHSGQSNNLWFYDATANGYRMVIDTSGKVGIGTTAPIGKLQVAGNTFSGGNGVHANSRVGIMNNGSLTSIVNASTYNDPNYPDYGLVFIQGPSTSSYNVWSISPDGPAKGDGLNFIYGAQATNIHTTPPKVVFDGSGNVGIGATVPTSLLHIYKNTNAFLSGLNIENPNTGSSAAAGIYLTAQNTLDLRILNNSSGDFGYLNTSGTLYTGLAHDGGICLVAKSGKVGIGTDAPLTPLHVKGSTGNPSTSANNGVFTLNSSNAVQLQFGSYAATPWGYWLQTKDNNNAGPYNYPLLLQPVNGNVGIGLANPDGRLEIAITPTVAATTVNETDDFADKFVISNAATSNFGDRIPLVFNVGGKGADNISAVIVGEREASGWKSALSFWVNNVTSGSESTDAIQEAMRINSDGNVGIGTNAPGIYKLNVSGSVYAGGSVLIPNASYYFGAKNTSGAAVPLMVLNSSNAMILGSTTLQANSYPIRTLAKYITFEPAGTLGAGVETMRITNGSFNSVGSVGIGTTAPKDLFEVNDGTSTAKVRIMGTGATTSDLLLGGSTHTNASVGIRHYSTNVGTGDLSFLTSATDGALSDRMRILANGNVGIGTTGPTSALSVSHANSNAASIRVFRSNSITGTYLELGTVGGSGRINCQGGSIAFQISGTTKAQLTDNGNFGINYDTAVHPAYNLQIGSYSIAEDRTLAILGDNLRTATLRLADESNNWGFDIRNNGASPRLEFIRHSNSSAGTVAVVIQRDDGNVGIGTTAPSEKLQVKGRLNVTDASTASFGTINFGDNASRYIRGNSAELQIGVAINQINFQKTDGAGQIATSAANGTTAIQILARIAHTSGNILEVLNASTSLMTLDYAGAATFSSSVRAEDRFDLYAGANVWQLKNVSGTFSLRNGNTGAIPISITNNGAITFTSSDAYTQLKLTPVGTNASARLDFDSQGTGKAKILVQGTERLTISSDGNVGIGTASPSYKLAVVKGDAGNITTVATLWNNGNSAGTGARLLLQTSGGDNQYGAAIASVNENSSPGYQDAALVFQTMNGTYQFTNLAERMRIKADGNVGIGTNDPSNLLEVNGLARFNSAAVTGSGINLPFLVTTSNGNDICHFTSQLTTFARVRVDCSNPGDAQVAFMSNQSSKWSIGNDAGDSHKFKIKVGLGAFSGAETFMIQTDGNIGIGTNTADTKLHVNGTITGTSKNFVIDHPTKEGMKLVHSCIEGPEAAVYYRGRVQSDTITLPEYWVGLVREGTITVQLTPNGSFQHLYVVSTSLSEIKIGAADGETIDCYYVIYGERADLDPLVVEKIV